MGFRFRRSVRLFPGVRLNFGLRGVSVSAGVPGVRLNFGTRRSSVTVGIPGTGLSYTETLGSVRGPPRQQSLPTGFAADPLPNRLTTPAPDDPLPGEIKSADIATLTSPDLEGLKTLINEAAHQRASLQSDWKEAVASRKKAWKKLRRRERLPLSLFMKRSIPKAKEAFEEAENEAWKVAEALAASEIKADVCLDERCWAAWSGLEEAHRKLSGSAKFWDVTSSLLVDRYRTRSAANFAVTRKLVGLRAVTDGILSGPREGMRFENANGDDLDIFPGLLLIRQKRGTDYALVDLRDLDISTHARQFIETDGVPSDARVVGYAWAKSNKDGSPDRRFKNNRQIPIALYGRIEFSTPSGVRKAYEASNCEAALEFGETIRKFQVELRRHASDPNPMQVEPSSAEVTPDLTVTLPTLPNVWPAYEVFLVPFAVVGLAMLPLVARKAVTVGPLVLSESNFASPPRPSVPVDGTAAVPLLSSVPTRQASAPRYGATADRPAVSPATPQDARGRPGSAPLTSEAAVTRARISLPALPTDTTMRRMVTTTVANVRKEPDRNAPSARVVAAGTFVVALDRRGSWVRVGDGVSEPWGWIHSSLLKTMP